jgi:hypothetical protein
MTESPQNIRLLKGIVIGLGVLIAVGLAVVVATIINRAGQPKVMMLPAASSTNAIAPQMPIVFGNKKIDLPPGSRLVDIRPDGDRLILRVRQVGGSETLVIISLTTGERLGSIDLGAGAATGPAPTQE